MVAACLVEASPRMQIVCPVAVVAFVAFLMVDVQEVLLLAVLHPQECLRMLVQT